MGVCGMRKGQGNGRRISEMGERGRAYFKKWENKALIESKYSHEKQRRGSFGKVRVVNKVKCFWDAFILCFIVI